MRLKPRQFTQTVLFWIRSGCSKERHVFISGAPRSGTTLLKTLLTRHHSLVGIDYESTGLFRYRHVPLDSLLELPGEEISRIQRHCKDLVSLYDAYAKCVVDRQRGEVFVDKIWPRVFRLKFVDRHFPRARWIHIIRDGRDCFCSARKHRDIPQASSVERFARYWRASTEMISTSLRNGALMELRYEDLTSNPGPILQRTMDFLGFEFEEAQLDVDAGIPKIASWDIHQGLNREIHQEGHCRWASEMAYEEQLAFRKLAGGTLERWGYTG